MTEKNKKEQKNLEKLLKEILSSDNKEKQKLECLTKLLDIMDNCIEINMNFDLLISSIDDLNFHSNIQVKKLWLNISMNIIRLRPEFRERLFEKIMNAAFSINIKEKDDLLLKIKAIHCATNCCLDLDKIKKEKVLEFLFFNCILSIKYTKENIFIMILNILKSGFLVPLNNEDNKIFKNNIISNSNNNNNNINRNNDSMREKRYDNNNININNNHKGSYNYIHYNTNNTNNISNKSNTINITNNDNNDKKIIFNNLYLELIIETVIIIFYQKIMLLKELNSQLQLLLSSTNTKSSSNEFSSQVNSTFITSKHPAMNNNSTINSIYNRVDDEKQTLKTFISFLQFYLQTTNAPKSSIFKHIVIISCLFVSIDREFSWKSFKSILIKYPKKVFFELLDTFNKQSTSHQMLYLTKKKFSIDTYEKLFFLDELTEIQESILQNNFKSSLNKDIEQITLFQSKSKVKIVIGSIFFIGMAVWGYEKVESVDISSSVILFHFNKLSLENNRAINKDIIYCLKRLIKKYGEVISDEWNEIFSILNLVSIDIIKTGIIKGNGNKSVSSNQINLLEITYKNIIEITDIIKILVVLNKFQGNIYDYDKLLDNIKLPKCVEKNCSNLSHAHFLSTYSNSSSCSKNLVKICRNTDFVFNIESTIIEYLLK